MGGIVAKHALTLMNDNVTWALITIATPHNRPPFAISREIMDLYTLINSLWSEKMNSATLISISGGVLDVMVSYDMVSTSAFTIDTSGMTDVWTGADHKMLLWCNQLIVKLSNFLLMNYDHIDDELLTEYFNDVQVYQKLRLIPEMPPTHGMIQQADQVLISPGKDLIYHRFPIYDSKRIIQIFGIYEFQSIIYACQANNCFQVFGIHSIKIPMELDSMERNDIRKISQFQQFSVGQFSGLYNLTIGVSSYFEFQKVKIARLESCDEVIELEIFGK